MMVNRRLYVRALGNYHKVHIFYNQGQEVFLPPSRPSCLESTEKRDYGRCAESAILVHEIESRASIVEHGLLIGVAGGAAGARVV